MPVSGPFFDGGADDAISDYCDWAAHEVGHQALADWHENMDEAFRAPTGRYEATVHVEDAPRESVVHDTGMIYNYWLEGYGSRNAPVTSFKGYFSAERAATEAKAQIERLVVPIPAEFMSRMGGV